MKCGEMCIYLISVKYFEKHFDSKAFVQIRGAMLREICMFLNVSHFGVHCQ